MDVHFVLGNQWMSTLCFHFVFSVLDALRFPLVLYFDRDVLFVNGWVSAIVSPVCQWLGVCYRFDGWVSAIVSAIVLSAIACGLSGYSAIAVNGWVSAIACYRCS
jgi:uncharacterized membrane protein YjjB (DUF3815 family)